MSILQTILKKEMNSMINELDRLVRSMSSSSSRLSYDFPNKLFVFDSVVAAGDTEFWEGDLDLSDKETLDTLQNLAATLKTTMYIHRGGNWRSRPNKYIISVDADRNIDLNYLSKYYEEKDDVIMSIEDNTHFYRLTDEQLIAVVPNITVEDPIHTLQIPEGLLPLTVEEGSDLPYLEFYGTIAKMLGIVMQKLPVYTVVVSKNTARQINTDLLKYFKLHFPTDRFFLQRAYTSTQLTYSPAVGKNVPDDMIYIRS